MCHNKESTFLRIKLALPEYGKINKRKTEVLILRKDAQLSK